jgi:hypothetical protein
MAMATTTMKFRLRKIPSKVIAAKITPYNALLAYGGSLWVVPWACFQKLLDIKGIPKIHLGKSSCALVKTTNDSGY